MIIAWMRAIADSLDEKVDENDYQREEILRVFDLIKKDMISPQERAKMIEEYHLEEGKRTAFSEGVQEGVKKGLEEGVKKGMQKGLEEGAKLEKIHTAKNLLAMGMDIAMIYQATGLTEAEILALQS